MADVCTFDSATVPSIRVIREYMVGTAGAYAYELELECRTETFSHYTALAAKFGRLSKTPLLSGKTRVICPTGTSGSLVWNGTTYTTCYIESLSNAEVPWSNRGAWNFTISFVRHTA
jgi:hypothetical protein